MPLDVIGAPGEAVGRDQLPPIVPETLENDLIEAA
jgi:hypothetical protein